MFYFGIILAIQLLGLVTLSVGTNYCDPALCESDNQVKHHIGCNNNGEFSSYCKEPFLIPMTEQLMKTILFTHNDLRNKVANGTLPRFQSAKRMTTLTWDKELEFLAGLNVRQCKMKHDECHNTEIYKFSGQNLASQSQTVKISQNEYESIVVLLINKWFGENRFAAQEDVDKCKGNGLLKGISHFTEMVQEKTSKVGCSIISYFESVNGKNWNTILMACNYSFGNLIDWPIYVKGPMCSGCETGCNPEFNGLCTISENVPPIPDKKIVPKIISPTPSFESNQPGPSHQSKPIPKPRSIYYSPYGLVSIIPSPSVRSFVLPQVDETDQSADVILVIPSDQTLSLTAQPRSTHALSDDHIPLTRSFVPLPSSRFSTIQIQESTRPIVSPFTDNMGTTQPSPRKRYYPTPRPYRQRSYMRSSRRDPRSRYSELLQPLLPVPRPVAMLGQVIKSIISFFIIP